MGWTSCAPALDGLPPEDRRRLDDLTPMTLSKGARLFQPGDPVQGYAIVLSGRVDVRLSTVSGREILLYSVAPGQSCIQSTLGLMGGDARYSAEATTSCTSRLVLLPKPLFDTLLASSEDFRSLVFQAFGARMKTMMELLEKLAFQTVECRLAEYLLRQDTSTGAAIVTTQAALALAIGTAREVVSRRLETWAANGWVETGRGRLTILAPEALQSIADAENQPRL